MTRKKWARLAVLLLFITLGGIIVIRIRMPNRFPYTASYNKERQFAEEHLVGRAMLGRNASIRLIGDLTSGRYWTGVLPLTELQKHTLMKLNDLLNESRYLSNIAEALSDLSDPTHRQKVLSRSKKRQLDSIWHGQRLVILGLLSEEQAAFVTQRDLKSVGLPALYADSYEDRVESLELTASQREQLAQIKAEATKEGNALMSLGFDASPGSGQRYKEAVDDQKQFFDTAAWAVLTPDQQERWSQLTSERPLPAGPPDLPEPKLSEVNVTRDEFRNLSPVFRVLADHGDALKLTAEQKKLMSDLEDVVQLGLFWISHRNSGGESGRKDDRIASADQVARRSSDFVEHAEQVALLGILSEGQAELLQSSLKKH